MYVEAGHFDVDFRSLFDHLTRWMRRLEAKFQGGEGLIP